MRSLLSEPQLSDRGTVYQSLNSDHCLQSVLLRQRAKQSKLPSAHSAACQNGGHCSHLQILHVRQRDGLRIHKVTLCVCLTICLTPSYYSHRHYKHCCKRVLLWYLGNPSLSYFLEIILAHFWKHVFKNVTLNLELKELQNSCLWWEHVQSGWSFSY